MYFIIYNNCRNFLQYRFEIKKHTGDITLAVPDNFLPPSNDQRRYKVTEITGKIHNKKFESYPINIILLVVIKIHIYCF